MLITPDWPAPPHVGALSSTRLHGVSLPPFDSLNLGGHVGDDPAAVAENRARLGAHVPAEPCWMNQVHGVAVIDPAHAVSGVCADAAVTRTAGAVCAVMTADCLPVLFCDAQGTVVGAAHAGWRGLYAGVIERTVLSMGVPPGQVMAWLGPAIGPSAFEVGDDVRDAFTAADSASKAAFVPKSQGKWWADLFLLARLRLGRLGVTAVYGGETCTFSDSERFFSYRRDGKTGRMASLIWLTPRGN